MENTIKHNDETQKNWLAKLQNEIAFRKIYGWINTLFLGFTLLMPVLALYYIESWTNSDPLEILATFNSTLIDVKIIIAFSCITYFITVVMTFYSDMIAPYRFSNWLMVENIDGELLICQHASEFKEKAAILDYIFSHVKKSKEYLQYLGLSVYMQKNIYGKPKNYLIVGLKIKIVISLLIAIYAYIILNNNFQLYLVNFSKNDLDYSRLYFLVTLVVLNLIYTFVIDAIYLKKHKKWLNNILNRY